MTAEGVANFWGMLADDRAGTTHLASKRRWRWRRLKGIEHSLSWLISSMGCGYF
jgi:hypothetical protein